MKKHLHYALYLVLCTFVPFLSLSAAETTLWESTYTDGVEINSETVASFKAGDILRIYLSVPESGANFKICYKGAPDWSETAIPSLDSQWPWVNGGEDHFDLTFTQEDITAFSGKNIYIYQGDNSLISKVTWITEDQDPETQPTDRVAETLWEGTQVLGAEGNDGFGIEAAKLQNLALNDSIAITITDLTDSYCQINIAANDPWTSIPGTNWESLTAAGTYRYAVTDAGLVANIKASGLTIQGKLCTVTKLQLLPYQEPGDDPEPQPETPTEYVFTNVWTGDVAISWNAEEYPGEQFDTYNVQQDMLAGLAKDDSVKIYYAEAIEGAQFALTYKAGDEWSWTDLAVTNHTSFFAYKVATDEIAQDIADHGLVIRGQGYHLTSIAIGKPKSATGVEDVQSDKVQCTKILRNGQVLIIRDSKAYNMLGQPVNTL
ncbi:MAG: hypothetical protein IKP11_00880 [Paludibacteraceae bacterium]|nr:hypothetical protein [Paludibacteraceae bacterium]